MLDKIEIEAIVPDYIESTIRTKRPDSDIWFRDITLVPVKCLDTHTIKCYQAKIENLHITYSKKTSTIRIRNSIHKYSKGNNYSDMYFSEFCHALNNIEEITGIDLKHWRIKKIEIGFNIETEKSGIEYLPLFSFFKNKMPDKMRKDAFWYGVKWFFTEYSLKIYDKTAEVKRHDRTLLDINLLRFEIAINKARKIPAVQFLSDFQDKNKLRALFDYFISEIKRIKTIGIPDFSRVSKERDIEMFFAGQNESYWHTQKKINPNGVKEKKRRYLRIMGEISTQNIMEEFLEKLQEKFTLFITS